MTMSDPASEKAGEVDGGGGIDRAGNDAAVARALHGSEPDGRRVGSSSVSPTIDPVTGEVSGTGSGTGGGNAGEDFDDDHTAGSNTAR